MAVANRGVVVECTGSNRTSRVVHPQVLNSHSDIDVFLFGKHGATFALLLDWLPFLKKIKTILLTFHFKHSKFLEFI
jgi:hypothetical protein